MKDVTIKIGQGLYLLVLLEKHDHKFLYLETFTTPDDCKVLLVDNYIYTGSSNTRFMSLPINTSNHHPRVEKLKYTTPDAKTVIKANDVINKFLANEAPDIKRNDTPTDESIRDAGNGVFEVKHGSHIHKCKYNGCAWGKNNITLSFVIDGQKYHLHVLKCDIEDVRNVKLPDKDLQRQINNEIKMNLLTYLDEWFLTKD